MFFVLFHFFFQKKGTYLHQLQARLHRYKQQCSVYIFVYFFTQRALAHFQRYIFCAIYFSFLGWRLPPFNGRLPPSKKKIQALAPIQAAARLSWGDTIALAGAQAVTCAGGPQARRHAYIQKDTHTRTHTHTHTHTHTQQI